MKREEYIDKMAAKLKEWNSEIEKLEAKAQEVSDDAKKEADKQLQELRAQRKVAEGKLQNIKKAGEDSWMELQDETEEAFEHIKSSVENAVRRFENI